MAVRTLLLLPLLAGCAEAATFEWRIELEDEEVRSEAIAVELRIVSGGCLAGAPTVWMTEVARDDDAPAATALPIGRYGLSARARNDECAWIAETCQPLVLPRLDGSGPVVLRLTASSEPVPACDSPGCGHVCAPDGGVTPDETCNGTDDDGDRLVDEGFDFGSDPMHCGGCGVACPQTLPNAGVQCIAGRCVPAECAPGFEDCDGVAETGCEVELATTPAHCGACGVTCAPGVACVRGVCGDRIVEVDSGGDHSCALTELGRILCWGANASGQLGDGTTEPHAEPVLVRNVYDAVDVDAGGAHSCAVSSDGDVICWGRNDEAQLGFQSAAASMPLPDSDARAVRGIGAAVQVAAGARHGCALNDAGEVYCWGSSTYAQAGRRRQNTDPSPRKLTFAAAAEAAVQIDAGGRQSCAVLASGSVACVGDLDGDLTNGVDSTELTRIEPIDDAVEVAVGRGHACALRATGEVVCWGENDTGVLQLGRDRPGGRSAEPVVGITDAVGIAIGADHGCALRDGVAPQCWGLSDAGQLGLEAWPGGGAEALPPIGDVVALTAGAAHTCGRFADGSVRCWGNGRLGQLGTEGDSALRPVRVAALKGPVDVAAGRLHACARQATGGLSCWGAGDAGQLGDGSGADSAVPVVVASVDDAVTVAAGAEHTCAIRIDGTIACWGSNDYGQLGQGDDSPHASPVTVGLLGEPRGLALGTRHACALLLDGTIWCWGSNAQQLIGSAHGSVVSTPALWETSAGAAIDVAAADYRVCAAFDDGIVRCRGRDLSSLPRIALPSELLPPMGERFVEVDSGQEHLCMRTDGGTVYCMGDNAHRQSGPSGDRLYDPVQVDGLFTVSGLSLGRHHGCALDNSQLKCWGDGSAGQLGSPMSETGGGPFVAALGPAAVRAVAAGSDFTCARTAAGRVRCFGDGSRGQLGDGLSTRSSVPVPVRWLEP